MDIDIKLPEVGINFYKPKNPVEVPIVESRIATRASSPNIIRHITFDMSGTELDGSLVSGQSIGIIPEGFEPDGKPAKLRLYSISSPSKGEGGKSHLVSTVIKRVIDEHWETQELFLGLCSNYTCNLKPGAKVKVTGPSGKRFILPENPEKYNYVFFSTGTGIAPFRGMIMDLMDQQVKSQIALIFGAPFRTDLLYADYFEPLAEQKENFHYLKSISREDTRPDGTKYYVQYQILDNRAILEPILRKKNTLIYICGLEGMETGIYRLLAKEGYNHYLKIKDELKDKDPETWTNEDLKKKVKPNNRLFVETY